MKFFPRDFASYTANSREKNFFWFLHNRKNVFKFVSMFVTQTEVKKIMQIAVNLTRFYIFSYLYCLVNVVTRRCEVG